MKKIFTLTTLIAAGMLIATRSDAQVYVHAHIGFPFRGPRVYVAPPPVVCETPAPAYQEPYPPDGVAYDDEFPGYAYYDYPAWNGHYRDYYYYAHYQPFFERRYAGYFNGGRFDRGRFQHQNFGRGYANGGYADRGNFNRGGFNGGNVNRGNLNRGYSSQAYASRGGFTGHGGYENHYGHENRGGGTNRGGGGGYDRGRR